MSATAAISGSTPSLTATDQARLHKAAQGFEAMFLRQILASARTDTFGGSEALFGKKSDDTFTQMRDERFAEIVTQSGKLGLAARLEVQLGARLGTAPAAAAAGSTNATTTGTEG